MKRKLLMLLAVLLTGGMLAACGPGDEFADDTGGGVVDEPLGAETTDTVEGDIAADTFDDDAAVDTTADADADAEVEGETVEMDLDDETVATEEDADSEVSAEEAAEGEETTAETAEEGEVAGGGAAPAEGEAIVVTFSQAAEGVAVENVQGADDAESIAATDESNPDLNLTVGQRYEFEYDGEGDLVFFNSDNEALLSSAGTDSAFAQDSDVQAEMQDGKVSFTLTEELAQEIDHYAVGPDEQGGQVNAN